MRRTVQSIMGRPVLNSQLERVIQNPEDLGEEVWEGCAHSDRGKGDTHMCVRVSGGEIQVRLIPSAFVGLTKAWL